jgi:periplasmic copper chaperone A
MLVIQVLVSSVLVVALQGLAVSSAWIGAPAAGDTSAAVFLTLENPTMYDVYVMSASSEAARTVEMREPDGNGGTRTASSMTAAAYGSLELGAAGPHLLLKDLTRPLKPGDTVTLTLATDGGERLKVEAVVK